MSIFFIITTHRSTAKNGTLMGFNSAFKFGCCLLSACVSASAFGPFKANSWPFALMRRWVKLTKSLREAKAREVTQSNRFSGW